MAPTVCASFFRALRQIDGKNLLFNLALAVFFFAVNPTFAQTSSRTAPKKPSELEALQQHYDAARTFQLGGDQDRAGSEYRTFLAGALRSTARAYSALGQFDRASSRFQEALQIAPGDVETQLDFGQLQLQQVKLPEARALVEKVLVASPNDSRAQSLLGQILFAQGDYKTAREHLESAVVSAPNFDTAYLLGITYIKLNDFARARLIFDDMITAFGDTAHIHIMFGRAYREGEWEALDLAIQELKKALAKDGRAPHTHFLLALAYLDRDGESGFPAAAEELQAELKTNPDDAQSHYLLGYIAMKQHDNKTAEADLLRASQLDPKNPDPLIFLGQLYADADRDQEAEATMRRAIAQSANASPNDYLINRAHYVLGRLLLKKGDRDEGEKELEISKDLRNRLNHPEDTQTGKGHKFADAATFAPSVNANANPARTLSAAAAQKIEEFQDQLKGPISDAYNNLGVIAAGKKDFAAASTSFQKAAEWNPSLETVDRNWGMAAFYAEEYDQAVPPLARQLAKKPDDTRVRAALALSYFVTKNYPKTLETLRPLGPQIDDDPGLSYAYAVSTLKAGDYAEGLRRLKALEPSGTNAAELHALLAQAFEDERDHNAAIDEYRKSLTANPAQPGVHAAAGEALLQAGRAAEAADEFRASLKLRPDDPATKYHLAFALVEAQHKDEAMTLLNQVIAQDPKYADAYYELGKLQLEHGDTKSAISSLEAGIKLSPESDYIHYQLAMAYRRDSRASDADRELKLYQALKDRHRGRDVSQ
jgi:tetratricopeptide (TPR) repeat protein